MTIKNLVFKLVLPLAIVSFGIFTKWWYVLPEDAPDTMMFGFPLAFVSDGWFTSMSHQIFVFELIFDFLVYFIFWFLLTVFINRFLIRIKIPKPITSTLWVCSTILFSMAIWFVSYPEQYFKLRRDWKMKTMVTGYSFIWTSQDRPDFSKYDPNKKQ
jgi:hypothetical protein